MLWRVQLAVTLACGVCVCGCVCVCVCVCMCVCVCVCVEQTRFSYLNSEYQPQVDENSADDESSEGVDCKDGARRTASDVGRLMHEFSRLIRFYTMH